MVTVYTGLDMVMLSILLNMVLAYGYDIYSFNYGYGIYSITYGYGIWFWYL